MDQPERRKCDKEMHRNSVVQILESADIQRIHRSALEVLEKVGFGEVPDSTKMLLTGAGCWFNRHGRLCFPKSLVEDTIAHANRSLVLHGQNPIHDIEVGGSNTYFSTGCGSVRVLNPVDGTYRSTTTSDVYNFARIVDAMENIHVFLRCGTPTEFEHKDEVDIHLCYACVRGTSKPISVSWFKGKNVSRSLEMLHHIAGGEDAWRARPFVTNNCTFVVPPLNFSNEACVGLETAIRGGMPVQLTSSGQMGATAPVTVAGTLVQTVAEVLGGLVYAYQISPDAKVIMGLWPMVSDLRTGAATTGSAEQALLSSAACQIARYYDIPNGVVSGISDSKLPDAQAGFEKGVQHAVVANSGGNILFCAAGSLASGMCCSPVGIIIDNEIIGIALRIVSGFKVAAEELAVEVIMDVCLNGEGNYLGHEQTLKRMKSDYFYPNVSDRSGIDEWLLLGSKSIIDHAAARVEEILFKHFPDHVSGGIDRDIRARFGMSRF